MKHTGLPAVQVQGKVNKENRLAAGPHPIGYLTTCHQLITHLLDARAGAMAQKPASMGEAGGEVPRGSSNYYTANPKGESIFSGIIVLKVPSASRLVSVTSTPIVHSPPINTERGKVGLQLRVRKTQSLFILFYS